MSIANLVTTQPLNVIKTFYIREFKITLVDGFNLVKRTKSFSAVYLFLCNVRPSNRYLLIYLIIDHDF